MAKTGLFGPYALNREIIDKIVLGIGPGTYVLEKEDSMNSFIVNYVGRSDNDLNRRLKDHCESNYRRFKFGFFVTSKDAFNKECSIFHDFEGSNGKLDNKNHPQRPENSNWQCPICDVFKIF